MKNWIFYFVAILFISQSFAQVGTIATEAFKPPYHYRDAGNPWYWKNKMPHEGYWQQDVQYIINAELNDSTDIIDGELILTYYNNSPDALPFVYFHLYQEAFQPDSYLDALTKVNGIKPTFTQYEAAGLGTEIEDLHVLAINGFPTDKQVVLTQDNTILRADLSEPIQPKGSITFRIKFKTYYGDGTIRRRMKSFDSYGYKHYDITHWYPRIAVYDKKFGWSTDQHLGREFYGDYGSYEVNLKLPAHYIVDGTGYITNQEEVMPDNLRKQLDIRNFYTKEWKSPPSEIIPIIPGNKKTWRFYAVNVHDFAATADPTYRIGETAAMVNGRLVRCIALVREPHAAGWVYAADYTKALIETYSKNFGEYIWPKIIVADAQDGMEYPMLTLDGGFDPYYRDVLAHEVGHQWFFGMIGSNETYRAFLDEGFTQFADTYVYRKIDGDIKIVYEESNSYLKKFSEPTPIKFDELDFGYLRDATRFDDSPLNTHSDYFNSALRHGGGYGNVYYKGGTMLYNLQYVLGDTLFLKAMQHYVSQWTLCHPYPEDFRNSIIQFTGVDLNWFFDQWLETTKNIDYAITGVKKIQPTEALANANLPLNQYEITFKRIGRMQMPLDFDVITNTDTVSYYIPNTWWEKDFPQGKSGSNINADNARINPYAFDVVQVLPKWYGWDKLNTTYKANVVVPGKLENVIIDPTNRLADINALNDAKKCPIITRFDSKVANYPDPDHYRLYWRPELWFNETDGLKAGVHFNGNYFNYKHIFNFTAWYNTTAFQGGFYNYNNDEAMYYAQPFAFNLDYKTATDRIIPYSDFFMNAKYMDGIAGGTIGIEKRIGWSQQNKITVALKGFQATEKSYLLDTTHFGTTYNSSLNLAYEHHYKYFTGNGKIITSLRANAPFSEVEFGRVNVEAINNNRLGKFDLRTRVFIQAGYSNNNSAPESQLYMAGANPEEYLENKFTRAAGWVPNDWVDYSDVTNHFQMGGGLNLRGYNGYTVVDEGKDGNLYFVYSGTSGAAANAELAFNRLFNFKLLKFIKMTPYVFADAGSMVYQLEDNSHAFSAVRIDGGIGSTFSITDWGVLQTVNPLTLRIDFPLLLNHPPFEEQDYFKLRWVVGINRAF
ncbi:MAG: M1 family metallopeptidase [Chitinophagales bacterium]|nr:M1 family metallopeptidase [Chitinophagales bacterium]MBP8752660.1 M1 family metallopeptidase [Chitinophagales bacterium]MBP9188514.1 M1 family metallopeptidase [Chitinophagales bacterium]